MCVFAQRAAYELSVKMKWLTVLQLISGHWSCDSLGLDSAVGEKGKKTAAPFPSPDYLSEIFFRQPRLFSFFPQCGALSQASLVIIFLEP